MAIVLVSGGMDSCVTAALASRVYRLAFLHVNYGQRTEARELRSYNDIADHYQVEKRLTVSLEHLKVIGGSSLTDESIPVPEPGSSQSERSLLSNDSIGANPLVPALWQQPGKSAIPTTYVPFRNAHLLSIAVSWAEVIGAVKIFIGAVEEDSSGYPDCRETFYQAFNKVIEMGTRPETRVEIVTPLIHMNKSEIVSRGTELAAPLHLTWSCYQNSDAACGRCESCVLRLKGFREAGVKDPIPYEKARI